MPTSPDAPTALSPSDGHYRLRSAAGLRIEATTAAASPLVREFFADFDQAFVLPNEKETLEGFAACLELNAGDAYLALRAQFGPFREFVAVITCDDVRIGGANFIVLPIDGTTEPPGLALNLNYVFVNAEQRRRGLLRTLVADLPGIARALFAATNGYDVPAAVLAPEAPLLMFIEQNDPFKMSAADYAADTALTGLDQIERIRMWGRLGAKVVDIDYVQPPLSAALAADDTLAYAVLGAASETLSACLVHAHLRRFFGISVLKGKPPEAEPSTASLLAGLAARCRAGERVGLRRVGDLPDPRSPDAPAALRFALAPAATR